jgi:hypothetical protein
MRFVLPLVLRSLSGRDRRALLWGSLCVAPILLVQVALRPYLSASAALDERLERERGLFQRELSVLADAAGLPARFRASEQLLLAQAPRLFGGADLVGATGALSTYIARQAAASRVFIQHSTTLGPQTRDGVVLLQIELESVGDLQGILDFLVGLEQGPKLVTVGSIVLTRVQGSAESKGDQEILDLKAVVTGYSLVGEVP